MATLETLSQEIEALRNEYNRMQHDLYEQLNRRDAIIEQLKINITDLTSKTKDHNYDQRRIHNTQLLKGKEPTEFKDKDNYASWAEGLKADLYPNLLELRFFLILLSTDTSMMKTQQKITHLIGTLPLDTCQMEELDMVTTSSLLMV